MRFARSADSRLPDESRWSCKSRPRLPRLLRADGSAQPGVCAEKHDVSLGTGGDMAAAHSGWALDSPAQRVPGCCFYCILGKNSWFDAGACASAVRRNVFYETCAAHLDPYVPYSTTISGLPYDPAHANETKAPKCPHCGVQLTSRFVAEKLTLTNGMSESQLSEHMLRHRQTHAGKEQHAQIEILMDHSQRAPSLLHHCINSCATSIAVTFSNKATPAIKKKMNAALQKYDQHWAFATTKQQRDTRPSGNESWGLLTTPGLLSDLLQAHYADQNARCALESLARAQDSMSHVQPQPPGAADKQAAAKKKRRRRIEVYDHGAGGSSSSTRPPPPPPTTTQPPPPARSRRAAAADDEVELDDDSEDEEQPEQEEFIPGVGAEAGAGSLKTAAAVWTAVLELNEKLHTPFDDYLRSKRIEAGARAQRLGRAWVEAVNKHSGCSVKHNNMHLSCAHLEELISAHGMLSRHDDEVLERENRTVKRIKMHMLFWGGSSRPEDQYFVDTRSTKDKEADGATVFVECSRVRGDGQSAQFTRLMLGRKVLLSARKETLAKTTVVAEHVQMKQESKKKLRDLVSSELHRVAAKPPAP